MANPSKFLDQLLISKVRIKALKFFFKNPTTPIHLRGAVRELNEEINAVRRELTRMEAIGLLNSERKGNRKYFMLNPDFLLYDELLGIVYKSFGLGGEVVTNLKKLGDIKFALLTQQYTRGIAGGNHNVDMVIVGDEIDMTVLETIVGNVERKEQSEIHYTVLRSDDFTTRKRRRDPFVNELLHQQVLMLAGNTMEFLSDESFS